MFPMRELLEQKLFPHVIKPGRYAGGEPGQIVKDSAGRVKYLLAYPDKYELGQSYVGLQTLYHVVNQDDRFLCERAFAVDTDAETLMRAESIPLFSLETSRPAREFDAIGFTLVDETVFTNTLTMIDLAGIAIRSEDRSDDDPLIMAGGPAVYNPEPMAPFIDLFFIGDGEEGLPRMLEILHEMRGASRADKLKALVQQVESVYVPRFYDDQARPLESFAPEKIVARLVKELKPEYYPEQPILPLVDTVHNHLGVEIMRGCPQGCKFCFAGPIYRPVRPRPIDDIVRQATTQINNTGYSEVTLLSLSATDYPDPEELVRRLTRRLEPLRVSISLPSLRPGSITPSLLDELKKIRRFGLTIAPEAGTERLRLFIRKDFPDEAVFDTARMAFSKGWTTLKLYFMIGLPSETEDDLRGIADICRRIHQISRQFTNRATINVTLSPFVPKPHTPFQWDAALPQDEAFERIKFVKRHVRINQLHFRHHNTQLSMLVAILGRGGREMARVIETAFRKGVRFDSWSESFRFDIWMEALAEHDIDPLEKLKPIPFTERLPWSHICKGPSVEHLIEDRQRTSTQLRDYTPQYRETTEEQQNITTPEPIFGRDKKRVTTRAQLAPTKNRVRLRWGKSARYRYMSHLENHSLMERCLRRARLPVAYSQGHNPAMRVSLGPPLPLGFTSEAEFIDITLDATLMAYMIDNLRAVLPDGIEIFEAKAVLSKKASLNAALNRAEYSVPIKFWPKRTDLEKDIETTLNAAELKCERSGKEETKTVDIRPALYDLHIKDDILIITVGMGDGGYARAPEVVGFLGGSLSVPASSLPFHRRSMYRVEADNTRIEAMDL